MMIKYIYLSSNKILTSEMQLLLFLLLLTAPEFSRT